MTRFIATFLTLLALAAGPVLAQDSETSAACDGSSTAPECSDSEGLNLDP